MLTGIVVVLIVAGLLYLLLGEASDTAMWIIMPIILGGLIALRGCL